MAVLDVLASHPEGQTAKGVAAALGLNVSTVYHLLNSLAAGGFVARDPMTRLFALGPRIPHLHQSFLARGLPAPTTLLSSTRCAMQPGRTSIFAASSGMTPLAWP